MNRFQYMAVDDNRQRCMPLPDDRLPRRSQPLAYAEAVRLVNPVNPELNGEVTFLSPLCSYISGFRASNI